MRASHRTPRSSLAAALLVLLFLATSACNRGAQPASAAPDLCRHLATLQQVQQKLKGHHKDQAISPLTASANDLSGDATALTESGNATALAKQVGSVEGLVQVEIISLKDHNSTTLRTGMTDTANAMDAITACTSTAQ